MKKYSVENAEDFSLGWTEQSFFFKFSVMGQPNRSFFHCCSLLLWISSMMCFSFLATSGHSREL